MASRAIIDHRIQAFELRTKEKAFIAPQHIALSAVQQQQSTSRFEHRAKLPIAYRLAGKGEGAVLSHLSRTAKEGPQSRSRECASYADSPDSNRRERCQAQLDSLQPHHYVDRTVHRTYYCRDIVLAGQARCIEN